MICHVVLIRLRTEVAPDEVQLFLRRARETLGPIPGVQNLRVGRAIRIDEAYPYCLVMEFEGEAALQAYQVHQAHQHFLKRILGPIVESKKVFDYAC